MEDCIALAKRLGERVGRELTIPVYLYEYAATRPERANLENIRRGQYEGLKSEIEKDPERKPDYGPSHLGKAGATVIGARNPLIAFNVYLNTPEVEIAKKVAKAIRQSSGGFRYVKALGLLVEGRAQVSINLTNFRESPVGRVVEMIRREAARYGVSIHHSELVGLVPQQALIDAAVWYTQLDQFSLSQILETRLYETGSPVRSDGRAEGEVVSFIDQVAAATAAPGGGSAAAYTAALAAALVEMVAGLTLGKKKYADAEAAMQAIRLSSMKLRQELTQAVDDDAAAFEAVLGSFKLPKDTEEQQRARRAAFQIATMNAARVPLHTASSAVKVMDLAARCAKEGNLNAISDAMSGAMLARAAITAAGYNVRINVNSLEERSAGQSMLDELRQIEARADQIEQDIRKTMEERAQVTA
jgi:glutamate formiminotransferase/formiminotetrahydrofolate cyclodeaminase